MTPLQKLAAQAQAIADEDAKGHPPEPFELRVIAKRYEAQAEIMERCPEPDT